MTRGAVGEGATMRTSVGSRDAGREGTAEGERGGGRAELVVRASAGESVMMKVGRGRVEVVEGAGGVVVDCWVSASSLGDAGFASALPVRVGAGDDADVLVGVVPVEASSPPKMGPRRGGAALCWLGGLKRSSMRPDMIALMVLPLVYRGDCVAEKLLLVEYKRKLDIKRVELW